MPFIYKIPEGDCYYILNDSTARSLVASGEYSFDPPSPPEPDPQTEPEKTPESEPQPESQGNVEKPPDPIILKINEASSAELTALDGIGAAKARLIIQSQPNITSVEMLKEIVDFDWNAVTQDQQPVTISFDAPISA